MDNTLKIPSTLKTFRVNLKNNRGYPIYIGPDALSSLPQLLKETVKGQQICIVTNPNIKELYAEKLLQSLLEIGYRAFICEMPAGEEFKSLKFVSHLIDLLIEKRFERHDTVIALGGGIIGDVAGFAASVYLRGIHFIQCPTTLLSQVDAAIGGKTGVNHASGKNLIGTFYQPNCVLVDTDTLDTLPKREILCGLAEVVKYGVICDPPLFWFLEKYVDEIKELDPKKHPERWRYLIEKSCQNKGSVIEKDERETALREILNFGHTIGHGIEAAFGYKRYLHGEAIALGMKAASYIAVSMGLFDAELHQRLLRLLDTLGFTLTMDPIDPEEIITLLFSDKKVRFGKIRFVLPTTIGKTVVRNDVSETLIKAAIQTLLI